MKNRFFSYVILIALIALACFTGCEEEKGQQYDYYRISVDSIEVPDTATAQKTFSVRFYGTVGEDGCHSFSHFNTQRSPGNLDIEVVGQVATGDDLACPDEMVYLDGEPLEMSVSEPGEFTIKVFQPNNTIFRRVIQIE